MESRELPLGRRVSNSCSAAVAELADEVAAVRYALEFEKHSILFLHEMKTIMREEDRGMVGRLIAEQQSHVRRLHELLYELGATAETTE